jgi:hypothetical protein
MSEQEIKVELNRLNQMLSDKGYDFSSVTTQLSSHEEGCSILIFGKGFENYRVIVRANLSAALEAAATFIDGLANIQVAA